MPASPVQRAPSTLINQPFSWLPEAHQKGVLVGALLLTTLLMAAIVLTNAPLQNPTAPMGIVSLQLAGNLADAREVLDFWGESGRAWARLNLALDSLYLLAYGTTLSLGCQLLAGSCRRRGSALLGAWLAWGAVAAAFLDVVENGLLIRLLLGDLREGWVVLVLWCVVPKFVLALAALAYLAIGGLICLFRRTGGRESVSGGR